MEIFFVDLFVNILKQSVNFNNFDNFVLPKLGVNNRCRITSSPHPARAHWTVPRDGHVTNETFHVSIGEIAIFGTLWEQAIADLEVPIL